LKINHTLTKCDLGVRRKRTHKINNKKSSHFVNKQKVNNFGAPGAKDIGHALMINKTLTQLNLRVRNRYRKDKQFLIISTTGQ